MTQKAAQLTLGFFYSVGAATTGMRYMENVAEQGLKKNMKMWEILPFMLMTLPIASLWPVFYPIMEYKSRRSKQ